MLPGAPAPTIVLRTTLAAAPSVKARLLFLDTADAADDQRNLLSVLKRLCSPPVIRLLQIRRLRVAVPGDLRPRIVFARLPRDYPGLSGQLLLRSLQ